MKNGALSAAAAVSLAAFLALPAPARADSQTAALVRKVRPAVVQIISYDASGKADKLGTGFFVNAAGDVITCRHVMEGASGANVRTSGGVDYPVSGIIAEDVDGDMVKLGISGTKSSLPFLPLAPDQPSEGDSILVIGNPEGLGWTVSDGIVSAVRPIPGFGALVQITAPISQGSSGSPVVNMKGQVVGIVDFQFAKGQNLNFAMPVSRIADLKGKTPQSLRTWSLSGPAETPSAAQDDISHGLADMSAGDYQSALDHFLAAVKNDSSNAMAWALAGYCWAKVGKPDMVAQCYEIVVKLMPEWAVAHYNLGTAYYDLGRWEDAAVEYKDAIRLKPDFAEAHNNLALTYRNLGRWEDAVQEYKEVIRLNSDDADAHCSLGAAYLTLWRYDEAVTELKETVRLKPGYAGAHYNLGLAYEMMNRYDDAMWEFKAAIGLKPDDAVEHYELGNTYDNLRRYEEAVQEHKEAIRLNPGYADAHCGLGWAYCHLQRYGDAVQEYKEAIRLNPDFAEAHYKLGLAYGTLKQYDDEMEEYKEAIRLKPDYADAHEGLGGSYCHLQRYDDGVAELKEAIRLKPDYAIAHWYLGSVYVILGRREDALDEYRILKALDKFLADSLFNQIYR